MMNLAGQRVYVVGRIISLRAWYASGEKLEAFTITGKASHPPLLWLLTEDAHRYAGFFALPSIFINLLSDHVAIDWLQLLGLTQALVTAEWLFDPMNAVENYTPLERQIRDFVDYSLAHLCDEQAK